MINHFNFKRWDSEQVLITNDFGRYLFLSKSEFEDFVREACEKDSALYQKLHNNLFYIEPTELFSHEIADDLRAMKDYIFSATSLHIFVLTTACNLSCIYCQAQDEANRHRGIMSAETAHKAVDMALQSPADILTFEFQGGEPLMNFPMIREIITYAEAHKGSKTIEYTLVSNMSLLTEDQLDYLIEHQVNICTSVDGPEFLHNCNRKTSSGEGSYQWMKRGLDLLKERRYPFSAIQTTTRHSLPYARDIVRTYFEMGMPGLFLRPLTPLGFAKADWERIGYEPEDWLRFYQEAFEAILDLNREGHYFPEQHAVYFLKKMFHGFSYNYMELRSPCGAGMGQLAYYCNGDVYTCDEARMVSENGDQAFRLGNVYQNTYQEIISSSPCSAVCTASVLESLPGCCDCVYQPYCGVCPVVNYALDGDIFAKSPRGYRCRIYGGILDYLFSVVRAGDAETIRILKSWVEEHD